MSAPDPEREMLVCMAVRHLHRLGGASDDAWVSFEALSLSLGITVTRTELVRDDLVAQGLAQWLDKRESIRLTQAGLSRAEAIADEERSEREADREGEIRARVPRVLLALYGLGGRWLPRTFRRAKPRLDPEEPIVVVLGGREFALPELTGDDRRLWLRAHAGATTRYSGAELDAIRRRGHLDHVADRPELLMGDPVLLGEATQYGDQVVEALFVYDSTGVLDRQWVEDNATEREIHEAVRAIMRRIAQS